VAAKQVLGHVVSANIPKQNDGDEQTLAQTFLKQREMSVTREWDSRYYSPSLIRTTKNVDVTEAVEVPA
jgi:hypothetical protein